MSEKITFKYEDDYEGVKDKIEISFESAGLTIYDFVDRVKKFALALGYCQESIDKVFIKD